METVQKVDGKAIRWGTESESLSCVITRSTLPIVVRITEGLMFDKEEGLDADQVLKICSVEQKIRCIKAVDEGGKGLEIPSWDKIKVKLTTTLDERYRTVRDLYTAKCLPPFIENQRDFTMYSQKFNAGTVFQVIKFTDDQNLSVIVMGSRKLRILLLASVRGDFKATVDPKEKDKEFFLRDLRDKQFPIWVEFLPLDNEEEDLNFESNRIACIERMHIEDIVHAFNYIGEETYQVKFPMDIDVKLTIGNWVEKEEPVYVTMTSLKHGPDLQTENTEDLNCGDSGGKISTSVFDWGKKWHQMVRASSPNLYKLEPSSLPRSKQIIDKDKDEHVYETPRFNVPTSPDKSTLSVYLADYATITRKDCRTKALHPASLGRIPTTTFSEGRCLFDSSTISHIQSPVCETTNVDPAIRNSSIEDISRILNRLHLEKFADAFRNEQINGQLLIHLSEADMVKDLNLTRFQARKLRQYLIGWKPDAEVSTQKAPTDVNANQIGDFPSKWTEEEVTERLQAIKLYPLGEFCRKNQVNGALLVKMIDSEILDSLRSDHGVTLNGFQEKKLYAYVKEDWRPEM